MSQFAFGVALGYQQINGGIGTATSLTVPAGAVGCLLKVEGATGSHIRFRDDGTNPTSTVGFPILATDEALYYQGNIRSIVVIAGDLTSPILNINYYGK